MLIDSSPYINCKDHYTDFKCEIGQTLWYVLENMQNIVPITVEGFEADKYRISFVTTSLGYRQLIDAESICEIVFPNRIDSEIKAKQWYRLNNGTYGAVYINLNMQEIPAIR